MYSLTFRGLALHQREKGLSGEGPTLKTLDYTAYWQYTNRNNTVFQVNLDLKK